MKAICCGMMSKYMPFTMQMNSTDAESDVRYEVVVAPGNSPVHLTQVRISSGQVLLDGPLLWTMQRRQTSTGNSPSCTSCG